MKNYYSNVLCHSWIRGVDAQREQSWQAKFRDSGYRKLPHGPEY